MIKLTQSLDAEAVSPRGATALANDLLGVAAFDEAFHLLRKVRQRHPSNFFLLQMLGILSMARHDPQGKHTLDEALGYFHAALAIRGNNPATNLFLSHVYRAQGKQDEAVRAAKAGVDADPESAPAHHNLGTLYFDSKEWDKALACYRRAAELDAISALPLDALGQTYCEKGDYAKAIHFYDSALAREPTFAGIHLNKGNALERLKDLDGAIACFHKALKHFPNYGLAHNNLGLALAKKKEPARAIERLKTAIECDPNLIQSYYALGDLLLLINRDQAGALKAYEGPTLRRPESAYTHFRLAELNFQLVRALPAVEGFRKVLQLEPKYPDAKSRLAVALAALGQWDGAIAAYQDALADLPKDSRGIEKATLLNLLGVAYSKKSEWQKAIDVCAQALAIDGLRGQVHANLGTAYKMLWKLEESAKAYQAALAEIDEPMLHYELASVYLDLGELDKCIAHARKAADRAPTKADPYGPLALAHMEKGEIEHFVAAARRGKQLLNANEPDLGHMQVIYQVSQEVAKGADLYPAFSRGEKKPADIVERNALAVVVGLQHRQYAAAARLFGESYAADPIRANHVAMGGRYRGACFAVLAGTGQAEKEAALSEQDKAGFRKQALEWLRADLEAWKRLYQFAMPADRHFPPFKIGLWLKEPSLENVREPALATLPADEQAEWARLWDDVRNFGDASSLPDKKSGTNLAALRKLADFPAVSMGIDLKLNKDGVRRDHRGNIIDPAKKIAELLPRLKGTPDDGEWLMELAYYHGDLEQKDKALEFARKAEALLRPFAGTKKAAEAKYLLKYELAFAYLHPEKAPECEALARRAVELAPDNWNAWAALASMCHTKMNTTILGGRLPEKGKPNEAKEWLYAAKATPATVDAAEKHLLEMRKCSDRAKALAPTDEKQWDSRVSLLLAEVEWQQAFRMARGKKLLPFETPPPDWKAKGYQGGIAITAMPELQEELLEAAEKCPQHVGLQFFGMMYVMPRAKERLAARTSAKDNGPLLTPRERQFLEDTVARVAKIAAKVEGEAKLYCDRVQAILLIQLLMLDGQWGKGLAKVEPVLRRIIEADPKDPNASMFLEALTADFGDKTAALELARKRFAANPSILNRYTLARALDYCGQTAEATQELEAALAEAPDHVHCLAGRAALWLRDGDDTTLPQAGAHLAKASVRMQPSDPPSLAEDIEFLQAVHKILSGQSVIGRFTIDALHNQHPGVKRYADALKCVEP